MTQVCAIVTEVETYKQLAKLGSVETKEDQYQHYLGTIMPYQFSPTCQVLAEKGKVMVESQDWATTMGFKLPGLVPLPPDQDIGIKRQLEEGCCDGKF